MTAIATFRFSEGVILCADTQETIPDYSKSNISKVAIFRGSNITAAWAGAGETELIETFGYRMKELLSHNTSSKWDANLVMEAFHAVLTETHKKYVYPIPKEDRPHMHLLVVAQVGQGLPIALKTQNITVRPCKRFETIGSGILIGQYLGDYLHASDEETAKAVAIYVMQQIKEFSDGCGKNTEAVVFRKGRAVSYVQFPEISLMEQHNERMKLLLESALPDLLTPGLKDAILNRELDALDEHIREAIAEYRDEYKKLGSSAYWLNRYAKWEKYKPKRTATPKEKQKA